MKITRWELLFVIVLFLGFGAALARIAPGPIGSDEVWYMQAGLNNVEDIFIMNRYTHVYLQKMFMALAPSPIKGSRDFWGFQMAATGLLVYLCARLISERSTPIQGVLSVLLFISTTAYIDNVGETTIDFTTMLMVMILVAFYLCIFRFKLERRWALPVFGLFAFLAFRAKELTIPVSLVLAGSLILIPFDSEKDRQITTHAVDNRARRAGQLALGIAAGIALFMLLNGLFLRDPLFGLRLSDWQSYSASWSATTHFNYASGNWYVDYLIPTLPVLFLLYLVSGLAGNWEIRPAIRLVWLIPLIVVAVLSLSLIKSGWGLLPRYLFSTLPLMAALAGHVVVFDLPEGRPMRIRYTLLLLGGILLLLLGQLAMRRLVHLIGWDVGPFIKSIIWPIALSILLGYIFINRPYSMKGAIVLVLCILCLIYIPLTSNYNDVFVNHHNLAQFKQKYYPFASFASQLKAIGTTTQNGRVLYVSRTISVDMWMLSNDRNELMSLYNIYFKADLAKVNFGYSNSAAAIPDDLTSTPYLYALLARSDWRLIASNPAKEKAIRSEYNVSFDPNNRLMLLSMKNNSAAQ